jgi:glutaredoxin/glutathione-dependent peroxiredoxin
MANLEPEFNKRGVKLIGLSANTLDSHEKWIQDINEVANSNLTFPIIADKSRKVSYLYDMIDYQDTTNVDSKGMALTIRAVFFIDPKKVIRAIIYYPASTGRNSKEVLRVIDSLQLTDKHNLVTPVNWQVLSFLNCTNLKPKEDVIIHTSISNEKAKELFPGFRAVKPYLRFTAQPEN